MRGSIAKSVLAIACLIAVAVLAVFIMDGPKEKAQDVLNRPIVMPADGYVGAAACKDCHQEQHSSWHASYHRTMTQVVAVDTAPKILSASTVEVDGKTYRFEREAEEFFVTLNDPTVGGESRRRQLVMMTGSHHMHVFWYESDFDRTPAQLEIVYLNDQARWVPRRSIFLQPPDEGDAIELGRWNQTCSRCHSTHPRQRLDAQTRVWDTHVGDFGIACEACHGPGEAHVAIHQQREVSGDDQIVHPQELPHGTNSELCGQCHSVHVLNFGVVSEEDFFQHGSTFRPGRSLRETPFVSVIQAGPEHWETDVFKKFATSQRALNGQFWPDGEVRVSGGDYSAMIESPCFQRGQLSCLSCHVMHEPDSDRHAQWRDDQLKIGMRRDQACLQCHAEYGELGSAHTHHAVGSTGSECMNCHMPHTTYGLLKTIRSHRISSPAVQTTIQTGRPNACNLCHLDRTLQWAGDHLTQWYGHEEVKLTKDEKTTSAAVLHFVKGDAAQRAIQASAFSWKPARDISGTEWMPPILLVGMDDPYEAVRIISERSLRSNESWEDYEYDFLDAPAKRSAAIEKELRTLRIPSQAGRTELLIDDQGNVDETRLQNLLKRRNQRPVELLE